MYYIILYYNIICYGILYYIILCYIIIYFYYNMLHDVGQQYNMIEYDIMYYKLKKNSIGHEFS